MHTHSFLFAVVNPSYLIVKEDKSLESYGLNAGRYFVTCNFELGFHIMSHL